MALPRVAVLRGGMSNEYDVSMQTGSAVLRSLAKMGYAHKDVVITRAGEWLDGGRSKVPEIALTGVDVVFVALHGEHGEDGRVQRFLSNHHLPYTGSRALASATALNKAFTKKIAQENGIVTPYSQLFSVGSEDETIILDENLSDTVVVKPVSAGSSLDTYVGVSRDDAIEIVKCLRNRYPAVLVEEMVRGREVTVGLLESFRDSSHYILPSIEIRPPTSYDFYSYDAKYGGQCEYLCPAEFTKAEREALTYATQTIHQVLDLRHYSRSDFIVRDGNVYFLEVNTLPGLTEHSLFPKGMAAIGASYDQLVAHLIAQASI